MGFDERAYCSPIQAAVALCARRPNGRPLASVEHAELQHGHVRGARHNSAERVNFPDNRAFGYATNRWVARHLSNSLEGARYQTHACAQTGGGDGSFGTGMAGADHDDVEFSFEMA
jgi:hypothetical protein